MSLRVLCVKLKHLVLHILCETINFDTCTYICEDIASIFVSATLSTVFTTDSFPLLHALLLDDGLLLLEVLDERMLLSNTSCTSDELLLDADGSTVEEIYNVGIAFGCNFLTFDGE